MIFKLLLRHEVPLHLDVQPVSAEPAPQPGQGLAGRRGPPLAPGPPHRALLVAGQRDQPCVLLVQFRPPHPPLPFGRAEVGRGQQAAEIPVALLGRDQQRHDAAVLHRHLRPHQRPQPALAPLLVKPHRPGHPVAVAQGQRGQLQARGRFGQLLGQRSPAQKAERAARVKFDVSHDLGS